MAIEIKQSGTVFTGSGIELFALRSVIGMLRLEMKGMKSRVPVLKRAKEKYGVKGNRAAVLKQLEELFAKLKAEEVVTVAPEVANG